MSISFVCGRCGHPIEVDDHMAGKHGHCKHCGHPLVIPAHDAGTAAHGPALRLRPLEDDEPPGVADHLLAAPSPLQVRPIGAEPQPRPEAVSAPDDDPGPEPEPVGRRRGKRPRGRDRAENYPVLDPYHATETHSSLGPPPLWMNLPSLTARFAAGRFRRLRDWLYLVSLAFLVMALIGYLFHFKLLLHLAAVGVIAANAGMLVVGIAYLVTLPFKESVFLGLANLLIPFYAVYYWTTRWPRMKTPVYKTFGSFLPILLVALAYVVYEEAPAVKSTLEREIPALEEALEKRTPGIEEKVDRVLGPLEKRVGPIPEPEPPRLPTEGPRKFVPY
jgi:DNA-directed RNA polymerase subunit RPC12/RpoP